MVLTLNLPQWQAYILVGVLCGFTVIGIVFVAWQIIKALFNWIVNKFKSK